MGSSQYASSFGRLQSISINFISEEFLKNLLKANSVTEMVKQLESTWYGEEIKKAASVYKEAELLEVAFNRHIVETNRIISEATPFGGKNAVRAYLSKWDLYNIELILSSKAMGREITETESLLVSSRNVPAGITAGNISHDEFKLILSEPTVEGVVNKLAKYDYGVILMKYLDEFQKTGDLGPMMSALHESYYQKLLESIKFFQGDEGSIRELIRAEIDNATSDYDREKLEERLAKLSGGVAIIKVGAATEVELKEKKTRVEDGLSATRAAIEEGIVPGGGVVLIRAAEVLVDKALKGLEGDSRTGASILKRALEEPTRLIATNSGQPADVIVDEAKKSTGDWGFDAEANLWGHMLDRGIIDPAKVTRTAVENAASVAVMAVSYTHLTLPTNREV